MKPPLGVRGFISMLQKFNIGDKTQWQRVVRAEDTAAFEGEQVHAVYATFAIARDAEWTSRQFVLAMKEAHEEGIGTFVNVAHFAPAFIGETVLFEAEIDEFFKTTINCKFTARVGNRLVAEGRTGQKVLNKVKLNKHFELLKDV